jgi:hypothetical protein
MKKFQPKVVEKLETLILYTIVFFEDRDFYETMWKNIVERGRPQMTIWRTRIACWITKATNSHSEYVMLVAFPLQRSLHESASMFPSLCIACLVILLHYIIIIVMSARGLLPQSSVRWATPIFFLIIAGVTDCFLQRRSTYPPRN